MIATIRIAFLLLAVGWTGCRGPQKPSPVPEPDPLHVYEREDIRNEMQRFARDLSALDRILRRPDPDSERVLVLLHSMERTAVALRDGGTSTDHPRLDDSLDALVKDVVGIREAVEVEPANFFLAGALSGSCLYCHR